MGIEWQIKHFSELTASEFHDVLKLRVTVFVVEQNCPYLELDGKDKKSYHLLGRNGIGKMVATARILPPGLSYPETAIGRVAIDVDYRGKGFGHSLMSESMKFITAEFGAVPIRLSAQKHLEKYYESHGFLSTGKEYLEDNIPHVEMLKK